MEAQPHTLLYATALLYGSTVISVTTMLPECTTTAQTKEVSLMLTMEAHGTGSLCGVVGWVRVMRRMPTCSVP